MSDKNTLGRNGYLPPENAANVGRVRQYRDLCGKCGARRIDQQLGLEPTMQAYIANMVEVFSLVWELLADDGTCWVNLGDSYNSSPPGNKTPMSKSGLNGAHSSAAYRARLEETQQRQQEHRGLVPGLKPKDLCGIPWRVALALQEPRYTGKVKDERDRVWLAAMLDAEGSICGTEYVTGDRTKTNLFISVTNTSVPIIDKCERLFPQDVKHVYEKSGPSSRICYRWDVERMETKALFIREIYPYLVAKRKQAIVGYTFLEFQRGLLSKKKGYLSEQQEQRSWLMAALSKLNAGEDVDLPDWVIEPPSLFVPGFYLRQDIIWAKPNPMPESVTDRCTKAHEYVFLLSKKPHYYFDATAIAEPTGDYSYEDLHQVRNGQREGGISQGQEGEGWAGRSVQGVRSGVHEDKGGNAGEDSGQTFGATALQGQCPRFGEKDSVQSISGGGGDSRSVETIAGRTGIPQGISSEVPKIRQSQSGVIETLPSWPTEGFYRSLPTDGEGERKPTPRDSQATVGACSDALRSDRGSMAGDQGCSGRPLRDLLGDSIYDSRSQDSIEQRRPAYGDEYPGALSKLQQSQRQSLTTRNKRSVWTVASQPFSEAHFATFPEALISPMILAGSRPGDIVLDPFMGSGTTARVAEKLGRRWLGCELQRDYEQMQKARTAQIGMVL